MTRDFYFLFLNGLLVENFVHLLLVGLVLLLFRLFLLLLGLIHFFRVDVFMLHHTVGCIDLSHFAAKRS